MAEKTDTTYTGKM